MARPRKLNRHLPRYIFQRRGAYYFVKGKAPWIPLGRDYGKALIQYAALVGERPQVTTVSEAISHYLESSATRLAASTLEGYRVSAANLAPVFGHMALGDLTAAHVYRYLTTGGNVQANRDRALLSVTYSHARRIGAFPNTADDPTKALEYRNPEKPRQRYVTDDEMAKLIAAASPKMRTIARFIELTGMRQGDALQMKLADLDDEGFTYWNSKAKKRQGLEWSDELRATVEDAKKLWRRFGREFLFESRPKGKHAGRPPGPYTTSGLRALWRRVRAKAGIADATLHDLRRKSGSDAATEQEAQDRLGHSDPKVTRRHYRAKVVRHRPLR